MTMEIGTTEIEETEDLEGVEEEEGEELSPDDELERDFEKFSKSKSESNPEEQAQEEEDEHDIFNKTISDADNFKLQIFMSLMFALLDGMHVFVYGFISKYKLSKDDIALDEGDKEGLSMYFRTKKVMDMINRLPVEVIGFVHMEYLYFQKFQAFNARMKEEEAKENKRREDETEDVEYEELRDFELPKERAAKKTAKRKSKKKPVNKAPKKRTKKDDKAAAVVTPEDAKTE